MLLVDVSWWWLSARLTRGKAWRRIIMLFMIAQIIGLGWIIFGRLLHPNWDRWMAKFAASSVFIWHFIGLSTLVLLGAALLPFVFIKMIMRWRLRTRKLTTPPIDNRKGIWTRREFVGFASAFAPPLFTFSLASVAMAQLNQFRVRRLVVPVSKLPSDLEGLTLAHVSDMHVGRFTSGRVLREMVEAVNQLRADLVLLTGDLINDALAALDEGLDLVRALDPRSGLYLIEGNHDLIENGPEFERRVKASGTPFLLDESAIVSVRGSPIQLLGLSWTRARERRDEAIALSVGKLLEQRHVDVFPILLAHHPHAFDAAAEAGIPLTLSGHTHGGQLMLNERLGFGPALFRYWSGLYTRGDSKLIVSNGVGNWFPLRANAPAEIIHVTLGRA
jgi:predicted MPP superfamily phosphohydrolase